MIKLLFIIVLVGILIYLHKEKVHIDFKSFFRKGFYKSNDDYGLYTFVAPQRTDGKTYSIVDSLEKLGKNKTIITNVESYYNSHKDNCLLIKDFGRIVDMLENLEDCSKFVIFFDEIFSVLETGGKLNKRYRNFLTQFRKRKIHCFTTCQLWSDLPINYRRLTRYEVSVNMFNFLGFFAILVNKINDGYNTVYNKDTMEYESPRIKTNIKKCSLKVANSYDTFETISSDSTSINSLKPQLSVASRGTGGKPPVNRPGTRHKDEYQVIKN